jgi:hypothetical protein
MSLKIIQYEELFICDRCGKEGLLKKEGSFLKGGSYLSGEFFYLGDFECDLCDECSKIILDIMEDTIENSRKNNDKI